MVEAQLEDAREKFAARDAECRRRASVKRMAQMHPPLETACFTLSSLYSANAQLVIDRCSCDRRLHVDFAQLTAEHNAQKAAATAAAESSSSRIARCVFFCSTYWLLYVRARVRMVML